MNHVNKNRIDNYRYQYRIKDSKENLNKIEEVIKQRKFYVCCKILYMIDNCQIIEEDSTGITVEICLEEHGIIRGFDKIFFYKKN